MVTVLLLFTCVWVSTQAILQGCERISVVYERSGLFGLRPSKIQALDHITCDFSEGITALIGPSGSGKSTLGKVIANQIPGTDQCKGTGGRLLFSDSSYTYSRKIIDPWAYMGYDSSLGCEDLLSRKIPKTEHAIFVEKALSVSGIPIKSRVSSLLESERRMFEIILALSTLQGQGKPLLVLDEYLDKDDSIVKKKVAHFLRALCLDPYVGMQVILITHSESAMLLCSDHVVALTKGRMSHQGEPKRVNQPAQLTLIP